MLRDRLINNLGKLCDTEIYTLEYLTHHEMNWFCDKQNVSNESVRNVLYNAFVGYFGHASKDGVHPYYKVWEKVIDGVQIDPLIAQTDLYGKNYEMLAKQINELYMSEHHNTILIILKAFAERDFEEIVGKYWLDENIITIDDIDEKMIVSNLDDKDLETIILFCGKVPNQYHN